MPLSLRQIRYFIATAEHGQLSQAAMELHVSQSAITTAIKGLEELLGSKLFERQSHGVNLTYEGHQFLQHAKHIMITVEEAMRLPSRDNAAIEGTVKMAVSFTVAGYFLPNYLTRFNRSFPNIELKLVEADRDNIEEGIIDGTYDLAMMLTSNLINQEDILIETLIHSRRRLWVSSEHEFIGRTSLSLQEVASQPYIMLTVDEASNTALRYWNKTPFRPNVIFRTSSVEAVRSMVANDMGVTVLSDMVYRPLSLEGRRLEVLTLSDPIPDMDVGLAWARKTEVSPATSAFCKFMQLALVPSQSYVPPH
jgi:DNA-binding transcriptional LysR family regulator